MKTKLTILFLAMMLPAMAQLNLINVGTTNDSGGGERIGRATWQKLNANDLFLQGLIYQQTTNLGTNLPANVVRSSSLTALYQTNPFVFGASNFLGTYSNVWSIVDYATAHGTNVTLTNTMSLNGGSTWQNFAPTNYFTNMVTQYIYTNYFGTNSYTYTNSVTNAVYQPIQLAVLSSITSTGAVSVYQMTYPELWGRNNSFVGQTLDFSGATIAGGLTTIVTNWGTTSNTLYFTNGLLMKLTTP
jgi:hypothetical protein